MSEMQRRGTVSKSSGPTHMNSYALRGIPIKYHAPSFVSDAQRLLVNRKHPSLPSQNMFRYDYTKERKVLEQSRVRTLSVIAEAEAFKKRQEEEKARRDSQPRPPVLSSTILMPTPVAGTGSGSNSDSETTVPSSSSGNVNVTASLGQFIRDLEGVDDPFEIASLQAINDMELLQTVLQPAVSSAVASPATVVASVAATPEQVQTVLPPTNRAPAINQPLAPINQPPAPVINQPPAVSPVANPTLVVNPGPAINQPQVSPPVSQPPYQTAAHRTSSVVADSGIFGAVTTTSASSPPTQVSPTATVPLASAAAMAVTNTNPFLSGAQAHSTSVNPFGQGAPTAMSVAPPGNGSANVVGLPNPFIPMETSRTSPTLGTSSSAVLGSEPSVGTLIDIGAPQPTPSPPIAIPNTPPSYASVVSPSSAPHIANQQPLPHSSSGLHNGPTVVGFAPQPGLTAMSSSGPPPVPPKPHPHSHPTVTPISTRTAGDAAGDSGSDAVNPPPRPPKGFKPTSTIATAATSVQSRVKALVANLPQLPNRPGLGIPVLPPIGNPPTSTAGSPNMQPSPPIPARTHTPPPPYYTEQETERMSTRPQQAPIPRPRTYKLPDPLPGMSAEEKATVQSVSGMGFPGPRVARAVKKFGNDRTKTLDFLIAVGKLEDQGYSGDGLETALIASGEDHNKAIDYLKRVNQYKSIGFPEKAIHEAYEKANKDWDQALDILTQERQ